MLEVAALTSGRQIPSSRFRVRQHLPGLTAAGVRVREYVPAIDKYRGVPGWSEARSPKAILPLYALWQGVKLATRLPGLAGSWRADLTWLERQLLPGYLTLEPLLRRPLVFDVDDAIWLARPWGAATVAATARRSTLVIAGNAYLASWLGRHARRVEIVPTAVDCARFRPQSPTVTGPFTVGWIGTAGNLVYLQAIEGALARFLARHDEARLLVVADRPPQFLQIDAARWHYQPWTEAGEAAAIAAMDVGLMPLPDDDWARGKCSYKMLQYLACGKPVVVSPVGMNVELLRAADIGFDARTDAEWLAALEELHADPVAARQLGGNGRQLVECGYSLDVIGGRLAELMKDVA